MRCSWTLFGAWGFLRSDDKKTQKQCVIYFDALYNTWERLFGKKTTTQFQRSAKCQDEPSVSLGKNLLKEGFDTLLVLRQWTPDESIYDSFSCCSLRGLPWGNPLSQFQSEALGRVWCLCYKGINFFLPFDKFNCLQLRWLNKASWRDCEKWHTSFTATDRHRMPSLLDWLAHKLHFIYWDWRNKATPLSVRLKDTKAHLHFWKWKAQRPGHLYWGSFTSTEDMSPSWSDRQTLIGLFHEYYIKSNIITFNCC